MLKSELVHHLEDGKTWEGTLTCKKQTGEKINIETRAIPVSLPSSSKR